MKKIVLIFVVIGLMLAGCGGGKEVQPTGEIVTIDDWSWEVDTEKDTIHFYGALSNVTDDIKVYDLSVYVQAVDSGKNTICEDTYLLDSKTVQPGESTTFGFEIPCDKSKVENARVGINYSWE